MALLNLSLEAIDRSLAADSLAEFVNQAWQLIEPETPLRWNWHLDGLRIPRGGCGRRYSAAAHQRLPAVRQKHSSLDYVSVLAVDPFTQLAPSIRVLLCQTKH